MGIITRSKSIALAAANSCPPTSAVVRCNNTKRRSRARSHSAAPRSVSPSPINFNPNRTKSSMPKRSNSSLSSLSSSLHSTSGSCSSSSTISTDSISCDLNDLCLSDTSTSPTSPSSSSSEINHLPIFTAITVIKSTRLKDQICMGGYTYQKKSTRQQRIRWTCKEKRNKESPCRTTINTTKNSATEGNPSYSFVSSNGKAHNHPPDEDSQTILAFKAKLKEIGQTNRSAPPTQLYNKLATEMKLSDEQMGMLRRSETLRKTVYNIRLKTTPPLPQDITFDIPPKLRTTSSDKNFLLYDHLYVEITRGPNRGHFKMLINSAECEFLLTTALKHMRNSGTNSIVKYLKDTADKEKLFIARERCEFINRCVLENVVITLATTATLHDVTKLGNDITQKPEKKQQETNNVRSKSATKRTDKSVVLTLKGSAKSSDDEEDSATETPRPKQIANNTRSTQTVNRLRPRTVIANVKESADDCHKPSTTSSSGGTKRTQNETDDSNIKQITKKKKSRRAI